jgi:predicted DNA-binding transcriptional regulator AlpA
MMHLDEYRKLRTADAAIYCGLSASTLNKLRVFGGGPKYLKLGRAVCYDVSDLDSWLATKRRASTSDGGKAGATAVFAEARNGSRPGWPS